MIKRHWPLNLSLFAIAACFSLVCGCASSQSISYEPVEVAAPISVGPKPIVVVGPIDTLVTEEDISHLSYALAPLIRRDLFCVKDLSVIPAADTNIPPKAYYLKRTSLRRRAREHGADIITFGRLRENEASKKIILEFKAYDAREDRIVFETSIEDKMSRAYRMQKELVKQLIEGLGTCLSDEELERIEANAPRKVTAAIEFGRGQKEFMRENYMESLLAYQSAYTLDNMFALARAAESKVYNQFNAPDKVVRSLEEAIAVDKYNAEIWYKLNIYMSAYRGKDELAMQYCHQALEVAPRFGKARLSLGARLYALGDLDGAIEETKRAASLLKRDALPRYNLGVYYRDLGDIETARAWFKRALQVNPAFELTRTELMNLPI